jgi:2-methylcitrate dehydratase PrpD
MERHTERIARFAVETKAANLPEATWASGKRLMLDSIGVALATADRHIGRVIIPYAKANGPAPATASILGGKAKVSPQMAALANGTTMNAPDSDGGHHVPTHVLPPSLALGEQLGLTGRETLATFIVGFELGHRLTQAIEGGGRGKGPTSRGWWHVGLIAPIASAATSARVLGLDTRRAAMAMAIASCTSTSFRGNMGTMAKALPSGSGARAGIDAALLAKSGFTGDTEILEAPLGFVAAVSLPGEWDWTAITERLGNPFALEKKVGAKIYPACSPGHALIDATLNLLAREKIAPDDVERIEAEVLKFSLLRPQATDEDSAGYSGSFLIAATLLHGRFGFEQITDAVVADPRIQGLTARIHHRPNPEKGTDRVTIRLRGGREVSGEAPSRPRHFSTDEEVIAKFDDCARRVLAPAAADELRDRLLTLEREPDLSRVMALARG